MLFIIRHRGDVSESQENVICYDNCVHLYVRCAAHKRKEEGSFSMQNGTMAVIALYITNGMGSPLKML